MKKKFLILGLVSTMMFTPLAYVHAQDYSVIETDINNSSYLYQKLNDDEKKIYDELLKHLNLSEQDKLLLLQEKAITKYEKQLKWKTAAVKKVVEVALKFLKGKVAEKTLTDISDFLFNWQDDLEKGIEEFLYTHTPMSRTIAHWTAKAIMFIAF